ncbi:MAG: hypothetical protein K6E91_11615, partial [Butyrivibrio sp.]|nr:hypothetical protein [Butyrivibrio sp.]
MKKRIFSYLSLVLIIFVMVFRPVISYAACPIESSTKDDASIEAEKYYNMLPKALRSQFESEGWSITIGSVAAVNLLSALYGESFSEGYVSGFTEPYSKCIILSDTDAGSAINHEMGHYLDNSKNYPSKSALFSDIYKAEAGNFDGGNNSYAQSGAEEYFAEAFREYVECAGYLRANCPRTYGFIARYMAAYGGTATNGVTEYSRCSSHFADEVAKATSALAARLAAQAILGSGVVIIGEDAPDLKGWLERTQGIINAINQDPDGYARKSAEDWKNYLESINWKEKQQEVFGTIQETIDEIN